MTILEDVDLVINIIYFPWRTRKEHSILDLSNKTRWEKQAPYNGTPFPHQTETHRHDLCSTNTSLERRNNSWGNFSQRKKDQYKQPNIDSQRSKHKFEGSRIFPIASQPNSATQRRIYPTHIRLSTSKRKIMKRYSLHLSKKLRLGPLIRICSFYRIKIQQTPRSIVQRRNNSWIVINIKNCIRSWIPLRTRLQIWKRIYKRKKMKNKRFYKRNTSPPNRDRTKTIKSWVSRD